LTFSVVAATLTKGSPDTRDDSDVAAMDDFVPPTSIEDEDTTGGVVSGPDVLAEVKLPFTVSKCSFIACDNKRT
jgi:hypothetical protein